MSNANDPVKWCTACQRPKPRAGFHDLHNTYHKRTVCDECYQRLQRDKPKH